MTNDRSSESPIALANSFAGADIAGILRERGWLDASPDEHADAALQMWLARAAELLGPQCAGRPELTDLLALVFTYDAVAVLHDPANQGVLAREGARDIIRELANRILGGGDLDSDRLKEVVDEMKLAVPYRSREMFHPLRVALAGRSGGGELDRVVLLIDSAAGLPFAVTVKSTRQRMLEFCAALD